MHIHCADIRKYRKENSGNGWILNIIDCYSNYIFSFPITNKSAQFVFDKLETVATMIGPRNFIQTDNGKDLLTISCKIPCATLYYTPERFTSTSSESGQLERANRQYQGGWVNTFQKSLITNERILLKRLF